LYNIFCIYVTFLLNSIWHAILDNFRPVSVWSVDLLLWGLTAHRFGEPWTVYSWLELGGMIMLFIGTAVYNGSLQVPGFHYPEVLPLQADEEDEDELEESASLIKTPASQRGMSSPILSRSPLLNKSIQIERRSSHEFNMHPVSSHQGAGYGAIGDRTHSGAAPSSRRTAQTSNIHNSAA
jgi:hypothetical protein